MIKGKLKVTLNDGPDLKFRVSPSEFLKQASSFKLQHVSKDGLVANYMFYIPGSDWRASLFDVFTSDLVYISSGKTPISPEDYQGESGLSYENYIKSQLPVRLNDKILNALNADYDITFELYV